jgi:CBS domain containing-hemolysin-like protein
MLLEEGIVLGDHETVHAVFVGLFAETRWAEDLLILLTVPALVLLNGLFVAAEFSLVAVRKTRIEELVKQGVKSARAVEAAITNMDRSIAATQLGITLASLALGWIGEPVLSDLLLPLFSFLPENGSVLAAHSLGIATAFILITFMHVVFGELIPKTLALQTPDKVALWLGRPLLLFTQITRPLILVMKGLANAIVRLVGYEPAPGVEMVHSVEELALLIEDTEEAGILEPEQAAVVQNVFRMSNRRVKDCLVPREKMASLELSTPPDKVLEAVRQGAHTRMPVYEGDLDHIVGIVNTKDLFYLFSLKGVVILEDAIYQPIFLKPDSTMSEALALFKKAHRPMALVRDDQGKILGLITLEDVLEEIVGDIEDEHDRPTPKIAPRRARLIPRPQAGKPVK